MSGLSEKRWISALTSILEELDKIQFSKLMEFLSEIPRGKRSSRSSAETPAQILQHYGLEGSILAIRDAMEWIPRRDGAVQDLLLPFVDQLRTQGMKRKEKENVAAAEFTGVKSGEDAFTGKVVQKGELRPYFTQEKVKGTFFYVSVANETECKRMQVYGEDHHREIREGRSYLFQGLLTGEDRKLKVTRRSQVSETSPVDVPEKLEWKRQRPVHSVAAAKSCGDKTEVTVEGAVIQVDAVQLVKVKNKRSKTKRQDFYLEDQTGSIRISMWDVKAEQSEGLSVGDVVTVANVKTNEFNNDVTLNSISSTSVHRVQSAGVQSLRILITAVVKASRTETQLKAEFGRRLHTLVVSSRLVAKAFGLKLDGDLKDGLVAKLPLAAQAVVRGGRIQKISRA